MPSEQHIAFDLEMQDHKDTRFSTIARSAIGEARYVRQTSCPGHFGHVRLTIEPYSGPTHFLLDWQVAEDVIPAEFLPAVVAGIQYVAGCTDEGRAPIIGVKISVIGGTVHPIDSRPLSYTIATALAFEAALRDAEVVALNRTFS